jgi:hypothetical protein
VVNPYGNQSAVAFEDVNMCSTLCEPPETETCYACNDKTDACDIQIEVMK